MTAKHAGDPTPTPGSAVQERHPIEAQLEELERAHADEFAAMGADCRRIQQLFDEHVARGGDPDVFDWAQ
jgi:hypothetical protein